MPNGALWNAVEQRQARHLAVRHLRGTTGESLRPRRMMGYSGKATQKAETYSGWHAPLPRLQFATGAAIIGRLALIRHGILRSARESAAADLPIAGLQADRLQRLKTRMLRAKGEATLAGPRTPGPGGRVWHNYCRSLERRDAYSSGA